VHGAALGAEEAALTRQALDWSYGDFEVPTEAYDQWRQAIEPQTRNQCYRNRAISQLEIVAATTHKSVLRYIGKLTN